MIIYTSAGLRRISIMFDLYDAGVQLSQSELLLAKDHAIAQADFWSDRAHMIADRLDCSPTWYKAATVEQVERCKQACDKWLQGKAEPADMIDAMNYCVYQADAWDDEIRIMSTLVQANMNNGKELTA